MPMTPGANPPTTTGGELPPTVFVVDDDAEVRRFVGILVQSVGLRSQTYASASEFLERYDQSPGCLLLDVRMPGISGFELQSELSLRGWEIPIIFVSGFGDVPSAARAMRAGAIDFLQKPLNPQALLDRIHEAIALDSRRRQAGREREELQRRIARLTERERELMNLLADGSTTKSIAAKLKLSPKTVDNHRARILEKLELDNTVQLVKILSKQ